MLSYSISCVLLAPNYSLEIHGKVILISLINFMNTHCEPYLKMSSFRKQIIMSRELLLYFSARWGFEVSAMCGLSLSSYNLPRGTSCETLQLFPTLSEYRKGDIYFQFQVWGLKDPFSDTGCVISIMYLSSVSVNGVYMQSRKK